MKVQYPFVFFFGLADVIIGTVSCLLGNSLWIIIIAMGFIMMFSSMDFRSYEKKRPKIKKIIERHKESFPKAVVVGAIISVISWGAGVIFVDVIGVKYWKFGLVLAAFTITLRYFLEKNWVFKNKHEKRRIKHNGKKKNISRK